MDAYFDQAINAGSEAEAIGYWKLAQWDGKTGCGPRGDAPWAWLINLDHVYFVSEHLNIGASRIEPHGQYHHVDLEGVMVTDQHRYRRYANPSSLRRTQKYASLLKDPQALISALIRNH
ncbi:hypothetical protein JCM12296A_16360 [Desulfosarcina cetonica]